MRLVVVLVVGAAACRFGVTGLSDGGGGLDLARSPADATPGGPADGPGGGSADLGGGMHVPGMLQGSVTTPPLATDLTAQATTGAGGDWAHWGYMSATDFDHRAGGGAIPNFAPLGGASALQFAAFSNNFTWSDGTPHVSASATNTGVYMVGKGSGFAFDFPADTTVRVLHIYLGNYNSTCRFTAHLADGSAPDYSSDVVDPATGTYRVFAITYRAGGASTLHVSWQSIDGPGNLALEAATLVP